MRTHIVSALFAALMLLAGDCGPRVKPSVPYDLRFIDAMVAHHEGAIEMARPAQTQALHPELKEFALKVIADQSREVEQMKGWREQWYPGQARSTDVYSMPGMTRTMMDISPMHMDKLSGAAFDNMFVEMMIPHHEGAVTLAKDALVKAQHQEIKALAQQVIDAQQTETAMMKRWSEEWKAGK